MIKQKPTQVFEEKCEKTLLIAAEHLDKNGNTFKSSKELRKAMTNRNVIDVMILFCPECNEGARNEQWIPEDKQKLAGQDQVHYTGTITCPHCGYKIHDIKWTVEPTYSYHDADSAEDGEDALAWGTKHQECQVDYEHPNIFFNRYQKHNFIYVATRGAFRYKNMLKVWPVYDGKLAVEWSVKYVSPITMYGKYWLQRRTERYRIVFNLRTGQTYIMQGIDAFGKRIKNNMISARMRNISLASKGACGGIYGFSHEMSAALLQALKEYHGYENSTLIAMREYQHGIPTIAKYNYFYTVPEQQLRNILGFCDACQERDSRIMVADMKKSLLTNSFDVFPKYMQKRSVKQRLSKDITCSAIYRWLYKFGIRDINIMNHIVDYMPKSAFNDMHILMCSKDNKQMVQFMKWLLEGRTPKSIKNIVINVFENDRYARDAMQMFEQVNAADIRIDNSGNIKEVHDRIMHEYRRLRFLNRVIKYEKTEQNFEKDIDGYQFVLAKDTDTLYNIGNALRICVGSYGSRAVSKHCTIMTMQKDNDYIACIELHKHQSQWQMVQLKSKYNHTVQEIEPIKKWVESIGISVEGCYDYEIAVSHRTCGFDETEHDYHVNNPRFDEPPRIRNNEFGFDGPFF